MEDILHCCSVEDIFSINFRQLQNELLPYYGPDRHPERCPSFLIKFITKSYPTCGVCEDRSVFPHRFLQYISFCDGIRKLGLVRSSVVGFLLQHCQLLHQECMEFLCYSFSETVFWQDYLAESCKRKPDYKASVDMAYAIPYLQVVLSKIKTLKLSAPCLFDIPEDNDEAVQAVSYVILHNIVTSKEPCLKHLEIHGDGCTTMILSGVSKLLQLCESNSGLSTPPYALENLSLSAEMGNFKVSREVAKEISYKFLQIVRFQMSHLKCMTVDFKLLECPKTEFQVNQLELCNLILAFPKQHQFQSLHVVNCPLPLACSLIEIFLITPATREQHLTIEVEESKGFYEDIYEDSSDEERLKTEYDNHYPIYGRDLTPHISQPLPESSAQFKCLKVLDISGLFRVWLSNLSELKLKSLVLCDSHIPLIPPHIVVQVAHIALRITKNSLFKSTIFQNHFEKFLISNSALKTLEILRPRNFFYPVLNHCLLKLYQQGRKLEEVHVTLVELQYVNPKEFFTVMRDLSQQCGTTLVLSLGWWDPDNRFFSEYQVCAMLPDLTREFHAKKIKKIVCKMDPEQSDQTLQKFKEANSCLNLIAEEVEFVLRD